MLNAQVIAVTNPQTVRIAQGIGSHPRGKKPAPVIPALCHNWSYSSPTPAASTLIERIYPYVDISAVSGKVYKTQLRFMAEPIFQHRTQPASSLSLLSFLAMELSARLSSWYGTAQSPSEYWPLFQVSCTEGFCFLNLLKHTKQHQASNWKRLWQWTHNPALATQLPIVSLKRSEEARFLHSLF